MDLSDLALRLRDRSHHLVFSAGALSRRELIKFHPHEQASWKLTLLFAVGFADLFSHDSETAFDGLVRHRVTDA